MAGLSIISNKTSLRPVVNPVQLIYYEEMPWEDINDDRRIIIVYHNPRTNIDTITSTACESSAMPQVEASNQPSNRVWPARKAISHSLRSTTISTCWPRRAKVILRAAVACRHQHIENTHTTSKQASMHELTSASIPFGCAPKFATNGKHHEIGCCAHPGHCQAANGRSHLSSS